MQKDVIQRELVLVDVEANNYEDVFKKFYNRLQGLGYVRDSFLEAIKVREKEFPTALPIEPYPVAIPHVDPEHINKPFISVARLRNTVKWAEMANNDVLHDVKYIFMLGFQHSDEHIRELQVLVANFQRKDWMDKLSKAKNEEEFYEGLLEIDWSQGL